MDFELKLPLLGDVMTEGKLVVWLQEDGARVAKGDPLYSLETDKVSYTVEAPDRGVLRQLVLAGETVLVGTVVGKLVDSSGQLSPVGIATSPGLSQRETDVAGPASPNSVSQQESVNLTPAARKLAQQLGVDVGLLPVGKRLREADVQAFYDGRANVAAASTEVRATPVARRLAKQLHLDIALVARNGKLLREADVRAYRAPTVTPVAAAAAPGPAAIPLSGRRKVIAERMHRSLQEMAQLTISLEVDMTKAVRMRLQLKELWPEESQPTITDLICRAAVLALHDHPHVNSTLAGSSLTVYAAIDLGLAVDTDEGLIVPIVRSADSLSLKELAARTKQLAKAVRENRLLPDDLQGGTFTITNMGALGIDVFTPIINPPQVAILGVGRTFPKLVLVEGEVKETSAMYLSLSFDHRAIDGAPAARFLNAVKRQLELPVSLVA